MSETTSAALMPRESGKFIAQSASNVFIKDEGVEKLANEVNSLLAFRMDNITRRKNFFFQVQQFKLLRLILSIKYKIIFR